MEDRSTQRVLRKDLEGKSGRTNAPRTRTGALRGQRCKAIVGDWRRLSNIGDSFCEMNALDNGFCRKHQFLFKADTRGQQQTIVKYKKIGEGIRISPVEAMAKLISESAGNVEYLRQEVQKLERLVIAGRKTREEIAGVVLLYNEERDRHEKYTVDAVRIRLDERKQEIRDAQARVLVTIAKAIIDGIGLMGDERKKALQIAATTLSDAGAKLGDESWDGPFQEAKQAGTVTVLEGQLAEGSFIEPEGDESSIHSPDVE